MQTVLYPFKFKPIFKDRIWGGRKIKEQLGLDYGPLPNCGEAWILSGVWDEQSEIANGDFEGDEINDLVETFMGDLVGESVFDKYGEQFPLLLKRGERVLSAELLPLSFPAMCEVTLTKFSISSSGWRKMEVFTRWTISVCLSVSTL